MRAGCRRVGGWGPQARASGALRRSGSGPWPAPRAPSESTIRIVDSPSESTIHQNQSPAHRAPSAAAARCWHPAHLPRCASLSRTFRAHLGPGAPPGPGQRSSAARRAQSGNVGAPSARRCLPALRRGGCGALWAEVACWIRSLGRDPDGRLPVSGAEAGDLATRIVGGPRRACCHNTEPDARAGRAAQAAP